MKKYYKKTEGFTLLETMVTLSLFVLIIMLIGSMYSIAQRSYRKGAGTGELVQNARVTLDRMSREIRQSVNLVSQIPMANNDPLAPPISEIFFQDGHDISQITYIKYFLEGDDLKRRKSAYYFESDPSVYVRYNSTNQFGGTSTETILEEKVVGEYFNNLDFWGLKEQINVLINLQKGDNNFEIETQINSRNL